MWTHTKTRTLLSRAVWPWVISNWLTEIRNRLKEYGRQSVACPTCHQLLPDGWPNQSMAVLVATGLVGPDELFDD